MYNIPAGDILWKAFKHVKKSLRNVLENQHI